MHAMHQNLGDFCVCALGMELGLLVLFAPSPSSLKPFALFLIGVKQRKNLVYLFIYLGQTLLSHFKRGHVQEPLVDPREPLIDYPKGAK